MITCTQCKKQPATETHSIWSQAKKYCYECKQTRIKKNSLKLQKLAPKVDEDWMRRHKESMERILAKHG